MGAKWSTVSTVTYADGSPSDDGSQTTANKVRFATIKTDLTDPLKTATDSIIAKLDERFDETTTAISTNYTTVASDHAKILEVTAGTITLLAASSAGTGYRVGVYGSGAAITVQRSGGDTINGSTSKTVKSGTVAWFTVNAAGNGYIADGVAVSLVATGTYTGDGSTSLAITGLGFAPKYVKVTVRRTGDGAATGIFETWDTVNDNNASGGGLEHITAGTHTFQTGYFRSLDSDGFTVGDSGNDNDPNASGVQYDWIAWG